MARAERAASPPVQILPPAGSGNPAYFPAFTVAMPPPLIGQGNWVRATPTVPIQEGPPFQFPPDTTDTTPPAGATTDSENPEQQPASDNPGHSKKRRKK